MSSPSPHIARVAFPMAVVGVYDYSIPERFADAIFPGAAVLVELKNRRVWGVAVNVKNHSDRANLKEVLDVRRQQWADDDSSLIKLYEWIASYYQCDLGRVFRPFLRKGAVESGPKQTTVYRFGDQSQRRLTPKQAGALETLRSFHGEMRQDVITRELQLKRHLLDALCKKGVLVKEKKTGVRRAAELLVKEDAALYGAPVELTDEQTSAVAEIGRGLAGPASPYLLHGITGSGKTHVYIELVNQVLKAGGSAILLVPEISLTPQTVQRLKHALGGVITVIHSRMSEGERHDSLQECVTGTKRLVVGVRSAVLVPVKNLRLIIVDEEHDGSYKQSDLDPRYNARDVAVMRGRLQKAAVVLGSATPSLESYHNALTGKYRLVTLTKRFGPAVLPGVVVVDMKKEHEENNWTMLSQYLRLRIGQTLENKRQIILLLNRRGFSTFLICKDCGHVYTCPNCSVHLIYHKSEHLLKCHQCGHQGGAPAACPKCRGVQIRFKGIGIQKAEEYIASQFPDSRVLRMDRDTTAGRSGHISIIDRFAHGKADILLGTQMVAKGLNFPGVALVGVLAADYGLHVPDFRSAERTFQLLSQVAGRAGRADDQGEVVIQTYFPKDAAILAAQSHDFLEFYNREIVERESLLYPPFGKLARFVASGADESGVRALAADVAAALRKRAGGSCRVLGPSPAVLSRLKNMLRYSVLVKSHSARSLQEAIAAARSAVTVPRQLRLVVDVDPVNML
jgi:primosomal protein N' (replication factor Y)